MSRSPSTYFIFIYSMPFGRALDSPREPPQLSVTQKRQNRPNTLSRKTQNSKRRRARCASPFLVIRPVPGARTTCASHS
eukprot:scaffold140801_cov27-Tisochrysis_lutea.AAC.3